MSSPTPRTEFDSVRKAQEGRTSSTPRRLAVVAAATALVCVAAPAGAATSWTLVDGFYYDARDRWVVLIDQGFTTPGPHYGANFLNNCDFAHEGCRYAYLWADAGGQLRIVRDFEIPLVENFGSAYCRGEIWVRSVMRETEVRVLVDVDPWTSWPDFVWVKKLAPSAGWQRVAIGFNAEFSWGDIDVILRNTDGSGRADLRVDDLYLLCEVIQ